MSHAVVVGEPTVAQRYVDGVLAAAGTTSSLPAVLLHCLNAHPEDLMMINGATGEHVTNGVMLSRAARVARMLGARGGGGGRGALMLGANSPALVAAQLGALFAGRVSLGLDAAVTTVFELEHFLRLWPPAVVFCEPGRQADVLQAARATLDYTPDVILLGEGEAWLDACAQGCSGSLEGFTLAPVSPGAAAVLLPTTGSTGPAKAAVIQHEPLIAQLLSIWRGSRQFPRPWRRAMVFSSSQWMTWWSVMTSAVVARVTLMMTSAPFTAAHAWELFNKYEVSWALMSPVLGAQLLTEEARATTLRMILLTGSAVQPSTMLQLQDRLPEGGAVCQGYGMTECHGFFSIPDQDTPLNSVGKALNIFRYKLLDEDGRECGPHQKGDLCIKSDCVIKSYVNNEEALRESLTTDGWLRSGDRFMADEAGNLVFVERSKFCFKVDSWQVSPEEVEAVIGGVAGVSVSAVCGVEGGVAALIVRSDPALTRAPIHRAVDSQLAPYKRLRAGIAFVPALPLTHNGKLHRRNCIQLAEDLLRQKQLHI